MVCRKNSIDNEQDNITSFRHFLVTLQPKMINKDNRLNDKTSV